MPKIQQRFEIDQEAQHDPEAYRQAHLRKEQQAFRKQNTALGFYRACAEKPCRRANACVGEGKVCFRQWWDHVHPQVKELTRAWYRARHEGATAEEARRRGSAAADEWDRRFMAGEFTDEARSFLAGPLAKLPLVG